jgi:hypothetical protein
LRSLTTGGFSTGAQLHGVSSSLITELEYFCAQLFYYRILESYITDRLFQVKLRNIDTTLRKTEAAYRKEVSYDPLTHHNIINECKILVKSYVEGEESSAWRPICLLE